MKELHIQLVTEVEPQAGPLLELREIDAANEQGQPEDHPDKKSFPALDPVFEFPENEGRLPSSSLPHPRPAGRKVHHF
jgi:hypothetical protein